jgi:hypothetical protein
MPKNQDDWSFFFFLRYVLYTIAATANKTADTTAQLIKGIICTSAILTPTWNKINTFDI